jgi:hypothetical protein
VRRSKVALTPELIFDSSNFPDADLEYSPAQRRVIDARLDESEEDLKKGRTAGPFITSSEMITHMKSELKRRAGVENRVPSIKIACLPDASSIEGNHSPSPPKESRRAGSGRRI